MYHCQYLWLQWMMSVYSSVSQLSVKSQIPGIAIKDVTIENRSQVIDVGMFL